jgi:hypothetical protein
MSKQTIQRTDTYGPDGLISREEVERLAAETVEYRRFDSTHALVERRPATPDEIAQFEAWEMSQNVDAVREEAKKALDKNKQFLALDPPTNPQNAQQIENLTRQMNGLIRQAYQYFDDISDVVIE